MKIQSGFSNGASGVKKLNTLETLVSLCKRRGFIFPGSELYGGLGGTWDYGPLGVELKKNMKDAWWQDVVYKSDDMEGLDAGILMHPKTWEASGHLDNFSDPLVDCKGCKKRFRATDIKGKGCPECSGELTPARQFNLMFKTHIGPVEAEDEESTVYLRPETAQGIFVNFSNVQATMRRRLPFGIAQIGKAFRNEITIGNFIFRSREFEQMEIEYFVEPHTADRYFKDWIDRRLDWYVQLGINEKNLRLREHALNELAHYAAACYDIEYAFPMGYAELEGIANRTDFDLLRHTQFSGKDLLWFDSATNKKVQPYVIEPSGGIDRALLAFLVDAYREEEVEGRKRVVLGLHRRLAPVKVAVLPLLRNRPEVVRLAKAIAEDLRGGYRLIYDDTASIGKLYRRQDEIGTLFCITVDVGSLEDKAVTVRERDSMKQERISIDRLKAYVEDLLR